MIEAASAYTDALFWDICYGMLVIVMLIARFVALAFLTCMAIGFVCRMLPSSPARGDDHNAIDKTGRG